METKYCENCGCKIFSLGCVNCNEIDYIEEQNEQLRLNECIDCGGIGGKHSVGCPNDSDPYHELVKNGYD